MLHFLPKLQTEIILYKLNHKTSAIVNRQNKQLNIENFIQFSWYILRMLLNKMSVCTIQKTKYLQQFWFTANMQVMRHSIFLTL